MSTIHTPGLLQISEPEGPFDTWLILCEAPHEVAHVASRFKNGERNKSQEEANARRLVACWNACEGIDDELLADDCIRKTREDRDELLKQRDELLEALKAARRAIGDHHAPEDCYATGPMTGNDYLDLVQCPACFAISKYDDAVSNSTGAPK